MIPPKIHYCWLGSGTMPELAIKCIDSWKRFCPDFEIVLWNENNYDFTKNKYMKQALDAKKWGFVPDYARLDIIYQHGGIYLDTDVEVIKSLTPLLDNHFFAGLQSSGEVNLGQGFGAEPGHPLLKDFMDDYDNYSFYDEQGKINLTPSPIIQSRFLAKTYNMVLGCDTIQHLKNGTTIYPQNYFDPLYVAPKDIKPKIHFLRTVTSSSNHEPLFNRLPGRRSLK